MNSRIILGTAQFGQVYGLKNSKVLEKEKVFEILELAKDKKIVTLDTAEVYGYSHQIIGEYHKISGSKFNINTKLKSLGRPDEFDRKIDQLLAELNIDKIKTLMLHSVFGDAMKIDRYAKIAEDRIDDFGVSIYLNEDINNLDLDAIKTVQIPFNLLDNFSIRKGLIDFLVGKSINIHARSIFLQGLLTMESIDSKHNMHLEIIRNAQILYGKLEKKFSLKQYALCYPLLHGNLGGVLIGVDSKNQLNENINLLKNIEEVKKHQEIIDTFQYPRYSQLDPRNW